MCAFRRGTAFACWAACNTFIFPRIQQAMRAELNMMSYHIQADVKSLHVCCYTGTQHATTCTQVIDQLLAFKTRNAGMLLCPACGQFYGGERGLRTHQQAKHATDYGVAKEVVETAKQQLIVRSSSLLPTVPAPHQPTPSDETRNSTPAPGLLSHSLCLSHL